SRNPEAAPRVHQALRRREPGRGNRRPEGRAAPRLLPAGDWARGLQPGHRRRPVVLHGPGRGSRGRVPRGRVRLLAQAVDASADRRVEDTGVPITMTVKSYLLSLPDRLIRSTVGLGAGVAREVGEVALPDGVRHSQLYRNLVDATLHF